MGLGSQHQTTAFLFLLYLVLWACVSDAQGPEVSLTTFRNLPTRLVYLRSTTTVLYHDSSEGNVWVSHDEGKAWNQVDIPSGDAAMLIEHPFNNRYAFILTKGTTHYRTEDRGKTWRSFEMPTSPAFVANPLSFHSGSDSFGHILYQGTKCEKTTFGWGSECHDETYYTMEAFSDTPQLLLSETSRCQFAHGSKDFRHEAPKDLIYCVAFDTTSSGGGRSLSSSRLFSSENFFKNSKVVDLGIGKNARGVLALAIVPKFAIVALKDLSPGNNGETLLYVTEDTRTWAKAQFPYSSSAQLIENAYTIVESTTHSLGLDVLHQQAPIGTLFVSNSNGTFFVESLKDTNRNEMGFVDYENLYDIEGVGLANVVKNARDVEGRGAAKEIESRITFDDGSSWSRIRAPSTDNEGERISCNPTDVEQCSLHLHSITSPHNFGRVFSSPAPGFVMGVGSIGDHLLPYEECDTFLSVDAGNSWNLVRKDAHKYEFGDKGSLLLMVNDEDGVDTARYSSDLGRNWNEVNLGMKIRARALTTVPDSTSQKFLIIGQIARKDQKGDGRFAAIFLDFAPMRTRQCEDDDFEKWYARGRDHECIMGHKRWYRRRKTDWDCYVGDKFRDPVEYEDNCECTDVDYECDYNFIRSGNTCVPAGPESIPTGACQDGRGQYQGSSGYRLIPGNTCEGGIKKDIPVVKGCPLAQPDLFEFPSEIAQHSYFGESKTILVRLHDNTIWQSSNEGCTWTQKYPGETFVAFYIHSYMPDRAYLITNTNIFYYTIDTGKTWNKLSAPRPPNHFGAQILHFHPNSEYLIWTGNEDCSGNAENCHAAAHYSTNNGLDWKPIEKYIRNCVWARDAQLEIDQAEVICESYRDKNGSQRYFQYENPLQLIRGTWFFEEKSVLFDRVVGFAKFSEFLIVAEYNEAKNALDLQISRDGKTFATAVFPAGLHPQNHAYTILESNVDAVFMHLTTSEPPSPPWGSILKSNSNGTYFGVSIDNVNRDDQGFVDFERIIGLKEVAVVNVVSNTGEAMVTGRKALQTRITHNNGGSWERLTPPPFDSERRPYECKSTTCALHIHGYTERYDAHATYSSSLAPCLLMAVGNVGESLLTYTESDTFLSRDAGLTWEEVHKGAHLWEVGDFGSVLVMVMVNDEEPTDHVLFSTDGGTNWRVYKFAAKKIRVRTIIRSPTDTSEKFILFGHYPHSTASAVAIHLDFTALIADDDGDEGVLNYWSLTSKIRCSEKLLRVQQG